VPYASTVAVATGEEASARRGASGAYMEVGEVGAFGVEVINVGGLDNGIAMTAKVAITLVVGDDKDDVGFLCGHGFFLEVKFMLIDFRKRYHFGMLAIYGPTRGFAMMKRSANENGALCLIHFVDFCA